MKDKVILITGGTGSLGKALTKHLLNTFPEIRKLIIFSRDEQKQFQMAQDYPEKKYPQVRFFIGDVRDYERLKRAFQQVNYVIHAAAMKHVHIAEYNPEECIRTNVDGPECEKTVVGIRPGEKIHEEMITSSDSYNTYDLGKYYIITPTVPTLELKEFLETNKDKKVTPGFNYNSGENSEWETVESLRHLIKEHVDDNFQV